MKFKSYILPGIFFLVIFVGVMMIAMVAGLWNPAGIGEAEGEIKEGEEVVGQTEVFPELPELHGYVNFLVYLQDNKIPIDCVAQKLALKEKELDKPVRDIASQLGIETYQLPLIYEECVKARGQKKDKEKPEINLLELKGYMNFLDYLELNNIPSDCIAEKLGIPLPDLNNEAKTVASKIGKTTEDLLPVIYECVGAEPKEQKLPDITKPSENAIFELPFLAGTDNLLSYLKSNNIDADCIANKLKVGKEVLNKAAKDIAKELKLSHVEAIRGFIKDCQQGT